ncbi:MAG: nucleoside deaminase [Candidatus Dadabacteria bacterium]|nr:MAG: nucleoside deaminase [Candidatus Dadabacteria bacterium]
MNVSIEFNQYLMKEALKEAQLAFLSGEVPVGAVVAFRGEIIARAHNRVEELGMACAHAEMLAIEDASRELGNWRLSDCVLCVTLEPCSMCIGAIRLARIPLIVYGARDERLGACGSLYDLSLDPRLGSPPRVISGVQHDECVNLMKEFFKEQRKNSTKEKILDEKQPAGLIPPGFML